MRKKLVMVLFMILAMCFSLIACGGNEEMMEDEAEMVDEGYITLDAYYQTILVNAKDGTSYETQSVVYGGAYGTTLKEAMDQSGDADFEVIAENDEFEGWLEYNINVEVDEEGWETWINELVSDTLYTTEEVLQKEFTEGEKLYVAKWASIDMAEYEAYGTESEDEEYMWSAGDCAVMFDADGGMMTFLMEDGEEYENGFYTYWLAEGETVNEIVARENSGYDTLTAVSKDGLEFAGWTIYTAESVDYSDEESKEEGVISIPSSVDYEGFKYYILADGQVYKEAAAFEEVFELVCKTKKG